MLRTPNPKAMEKWGGRVEVMINSASNNKDVKHHGILQVGNKLQLQDDLKREPYQNTIHTR